MAKLISVHRVKRIFAIVDDKDFERVRRFNWYVNQMESTSYAYRFLPSDEGGNQKTQSLHRFIMNEPAGMEIDHRNLNGLDCRKDNLRIATSSQNKMNQRTRRDNSSGRKGVSWQASRKKWAAYIQIDQKRIPLGRFETFDAALIARESAEREHYGEFARAA